MSVNRWWHADFITAFYEETLGDALANYVLQKSSSKMHVFREAPCAASEVWTATQVKELVAQVGGAVSLNPAAIIGLGHSPPNHRHPQLRQ